MYQRNLIVGNHVFDYPGSTLCLAERADVVIVTRSIFLMRDSNLDILPLTVTDGLFYAFTVYRVEVHFSMEAHNLSIA